MKKNLTIMGLLFSIAIAQSVFAANIQDGFTEDNTVVESPNTNSTENPSFTEDNTVVESPNTNSTENPSFTEDNTTVENIDTPTTSTEETNTSSRRRSGGSRRTTTAPAGNLAGGEVLGASTDAGSCKVLATFMKIGSNNNVEEVKMLQSFLNSKMNAGLPVTGYFGPLTLQAVKNFQAQYANEILKPWVEAGLMTDATPTGYVYKTTQYAINKMLCPEAELMSPVLN